MCVAGFHTNPIHALRPEEVFLWSGAGISMPSPTKLPSGKDLTRQVIEHCCLPGTWDTLIDRYFLPANLTDAAGQMKTFPRLEAVLESLTPVVGFDALTPLSVCGRAIPNDRHEIIARHILGGGCHVTVNFDPCIEHCLPSNARDRVIHLHGMYGRNTLETLGARISRITTGLPQIMVQKLNDLLTTSRGLVFIGYSGSDYFDINPFFGNLARQGTNLSNLHVVWLKHSNCRPFNRSWNPNLPGSPILKSLSVCHAVITYMEGDAALFLEQLATIWSLPSTVRPSTLPSSASSSHSHISALQRLLSTAQLFTSMGIGKGLLALEPDLLSQARLYSADHEKQTQIYYYLNDGYRNVGKYLHAINYAKAIPRQPLYSEVLAYHRIAGDYWLRGDHMQAFRCFIFALRLSKNALVYSLLDPHEYGRMLRERTEIQITFLHWLRDLTKQGFLCFLIRRFSVAILRGSLRSRHVIEHDPHALTKLARLHEELCADRLGVPFPSDIEERFPGLRYVYHETDSILGTINYMRYELTKAFKNGQALRASDIDYLYGLSQLIEDRSGMLKAALLRKAALDHDASSIFTVFQESEWNKKNRRRWIRSFQSRVPW